jgi:hypothetical protein
MTEKQVDRPSALEEVTEAAFNGVLRALERRHLEIREFPGPILIGIIAWPELRQAEGLAQRVRDQAPE